MNSCVGTPDAQLGIDARTHVRPEASMDNERDLRSNIARTEEAGDLLPQQYYDIIAGRSRPNGVRDLMAAVLEDAIRAYVTNLLGKTRAQRRRFQEVKAWLETRGDKAPFSFETICETFDIDPDELRRRLRTRPPLKLSRYRRAVQRAKTKAA
jgi:hypothetical protein